MPCLHQATYCISGMHSANEPNWDEWECIWINFSRYYKPLPLEHFLCQNSGEPLSFSWNINSFTSFSKHLTRLQAYIYILGQNCLSSGWLSLYLSLELTFGYSAYSLCSSITPQVWANSPFREQYYPYDLQGSY